eukprot:scaffold93325_cov18-Tisochrysis_lutea.AAC.1
MVVVAYPEGGGNNADVYIIRCNPYKCVFCRGRLCLNPMLAENMQPRHVLLLQSEISSCYSCWGYANGEQPLVHRNDI